LFDELIYAVNYSNYDSGSILIVHLLVGKVIEVAAGTLYFKTFVLVPFHLNGVY